MIYVIAGLPGAGKTYCAVHFAIERWKKDKNHKIFSNFPIFWKGVSSYIWKPEYVSEDLFNATVIIDEAYRDYNSRNYKDFNQDSHVTFATSRHNGMDFYFIAQSVQRIDTVIREIANEIFLVGNIHIPFNGRPLWFTIDSYDGIEALKMRAVAGKKAVLRTFRIRFRKEVAMSYDTLQFRKDSENEFIGERWFKVPDKGNGPKHRFAGINLFWSHRIAPYIRSARNRVVRSDDTQHGDINGTTTCIDNRISFRSNRIISILQALREKGRQITGRRKTYDLWEPRGMAREIIYRNWAMWKPIFSWVTSYKLVTRCPRTCASTDAEPHKRPAAVTPLPSGLWGSCLDRIGSISEEELWRRI